MSNPITKPVLWTARDAAQALGVSANSEAEWTAHGVSIDSRSLEPGDLFVAIVGERFDGHDYVHAALVENGAAAALVDRDPAEHWPDLPAERFLQVSDTLDGLTALGIAARARFTGKVIGITGSVGKTGTKDMTAHALAACGRVHATLGNLNNHFGVPLTLARLPQDADFAVIEMGMNHGGEISALTRMARPHVAIITAVTEAHLENFADIEGIADAKSEIMEGLEPGGTAILNRDMALYHRVAGNARALADQRDDGIRTLGFGSHISAYGRVMDHAVDADGTHVFALIGDHSLGYVVGAPGRHWAFNSIAVLAALNVLDVDVRRAADALATMHAPSGRGARREVSLAMGAFVLIDESYNASPESMRAAINTLALSKPGPGGRRIAILGDMLELGPRSPQLHADLAYSLMEHNIDCVHTAGPLSAHLHNALPQKLRGSHAADSAQLRTAILADVRGGDVVMVKGSKGSLMGVIVKALIELEQTAPTPPSTTTTTPFDGGTAHAAVLA